MAISMASLRSGTALRPPLLVTYGVAGVGKTVFAANSVKPVIMQTEDGLGTIKVPTFGMLRSLDEVFAAINALYEEPHEFRTVVLDSLDWLEPLIWKRTCQDNKWQDIEQPGYGKGYLAALDTWRLFLDSMTTLRDERGMGIILIAHCDIRRFDSPETEPYDRYVIKLQSRAAALVQEHADAVLFANYRVSTIKTDVGFKKQVIRGVSGGERLLHTTERPAYLAKNRFGLPDTLPLDWSALAACIPYYAANTAPDAEGAL